MIYKRQMTPAAAADLEAIDDYITVTLDAPAAAHNLMVEIDKSIKRACENPYLYRLSRLETLRQKGYRCIVVDNYVTLYLVDETNHRIIIARVFYGAMDYEKYV